MNCIKQISSRGSVKCPHTRAKEENILNTVSMVAEYIYMQLHQIQQQKIRGLSSHQSKVRKMLWTLYPWWLGNALNTVSMVAGYIYVHVCNCIRYSSWISVGCPHTRANKQKWSEHCIHGTSIFFFFFFFQQMSFDREKSETKPTASILKKKKRKKIKTQTVNLC